MGDCAIAVQPPQRSDTSGTSNRGECRDKIPSSMTRRDRCRTGLQGLRVRVFSVTPIRQTLQIIFPGNHKRLKRGKPIGQIDRCVGMLFQITFVALEASAEPVTSLLRLMMYFIRNGAIQIDISEPIMSLVPV